MRDYGRTNVMPYAAAPAVGNGGDAYWNTASKTLYLSDGSTWVAAGSSFIYDGVRRRHSAATLSFPNGAQTPIPFDTVLETQGPSTFAWDAVNNWITIPSTGLYNVQATIQGDGSFAFTGGTAYLDIGVNGYQAACDMPGGNAYETFETKAVLWLAAGDHVQARFGNYSGATRTMRGSSTPIAGNNPWSPTLSIWRAGGAQGPKGDMGAVPPGGAAGTVLTKNTATDGDTGWGVPKLYDAWQVNYNYLMNNANSYADQAFSVPGSRVKYAGWLKLTAGTIYYGYGGATISGPQLGLYTYAQNGPDGQPLQTYTVQTGTSISSPNWGRMNGGLSMAYPLGAGQDGTFYVRGSAIGSNCYWWGMIVCELYTN